MRTLYIIIISIGIIICPLSLQHIADSTHKCNVSVATERSLIILPYSITDEWNYKLLLTPSFSDYIGLDEYDLAINYDVTTKEQLWQNLWSSLLSVLATLLGIIFSAIIALWIYRRGERKQKEDYAKEMLQRIIEMNGYIKTSLEDVRRSIEVIDSYTMRIDNNPLDIYTMNYIPVYFIARIRQLDVKYISKTFFHNNFSSTDSLIFIRNIEHFNVSL